MAREEQSLILEGPVGALEACISFDPALSEPKFAAVICHPHPLFEGTMHNKVVTTVARTLVKLGIPNIRFNFRGVGKSEGTFDETHGETDDCQIALDFLKTRFPNSKPLLIGFSFGAFIATKITQLNPDIVQLVTLAPAVHNNDYASYSGRIHCPWLVIQPEQDEVVPPAKVFEWYESLNADKTLVKVPECSHFFHGKLVDLQSILTEHLGQLE